MCKGAKGARAKGIMCRHDRQVRDPERSISMLTRRAGAQAT